MLLLAELDGEKESGNMRMYSGRDVKCIVEAFMAQHFNFDGVYLNDESIYELEEICKWYGREVENIVSNYD